MNIYQDKLFVEVDLILRRGGHINRSALSQYEYICAHFPSIERFYNNYGCSIHQHPDGFFYMVAKGSAFRTRLLPKTCVHLGTFIALKARDPEITRSSGRISTKQLQQDLLTSVPRPVLQKIYAPKRRDISADAYIGEEIAKALEMLAELKFIQFEGDAFKPLEAINRFADVPRQGAPLSEDAYFRLRIQNAVVFDGDDSDCTEENGDGDGQDQ